MTTLDALPDDAILERAEAELELGITYRLLDRRPEALNHFRHALEAARAVHNRDLEGKAALEAAEVHKLTENYPEALRLLVQAKDAFNNAQNRVGTAS